MEILTQSRMRTYRECARKHDLMYNKMYRPVQEGEALRFGSLIHRGLEAWWRGEDPYAAMSGETDPYERVKAEEIMRGYDGAYRIAREKTYRLVSTEQKFEMPLLNPGTMLPSRTWRLAGKLDTVLDVIETKRRAVMEHKTTSENLDDGDYWARLAIDHQISNYVLGAESLGHEVDDTIYDVIKKPALRPGKATPTESRKYKADGTLYANQRDKDETPEEFRIRLRGDIEENVGKYYRQRVVARMNSQVEDFMYDAWQTGQEIRAGQRESCPEEPRGVPAVLQMPVLGCLHQRADPLEHPESFKVLENPHPELV